MDRDGTVWSQQIFAYGTLMFDVVWRAVVGHGRPAGGATLPGYVRRKVRGADYPVILPGTPDRCVRGRLYCEVPDIVLPALDRFEGELYQRRQVTVARDGGGMAQPWVYVLNPEFLECVGDDAWDPKSFLSQRLPDFLVRHGLD